MYVRTYVHGSMSEEDPIWPMLRSCKNGEFDKKKNKRCFPYVTMAMSKFCCFFARGRFGFSNVLVGSGKKYCKYAKLTRPADRQTDRHEKKSSDRIRGNQVLFIRREKGGES